MKIERTFIEGGDRYAFDFQHCTSSKGWAQVDTPEDAWYFGTWAHPERFEIVNFAEGDLTITRCADAAEFAAELRRIEAFYAARRGGPARIDPGIGKSGARIAAAFRAAGLADMLH